MNIAILNKRHLTAIDFYRLTGPWGQLCRKYGHDLRTVDPGKWDQFASTDVFICHCPVSGEELATLLEAKSIGAKVIVDIDDNIFAVPWSNPAHYFLQDNNAQNVLFTAISEADIITVSTQALKESLEQRFGGMDKVIVINNAFNDYLFKLPEEANNNQVKTVMWRGSNTHDGDLFNVRDAFQPFEGIQYHFFGFPAWFMHKDHGGPLTHFQYTKFNRSLFNYFQGLRNMAPDYMVFPLVDDEFNRSKSNIAWIEATLAGAVCIAPAYMPEFADNPVLTYSNTKELKALLEAIGTGEDFSRYYLESVDVLYGKYALSMINELRHAIILDNETGQADH